MSRGKGLFGGSHRFWIYLRDTCLGDSQNTSQDREKGFARKKSYLLGVRALSLPSIDRFFTTRARAFGSLFVLWAT